MRWRCRRGMKELDLLLERFLEHGYAESSEVEKDAFEALLARQDDELWDWFYQGREPDDAALQRLVQRIRDNFVL
nr:succinate dehydrogenase assembly factor 2 [Methylonatrum kenyense]